MLHALVAADPKHFRMSCAIHLIVTLWQSISMGRLCEGRLFQGGPLVELVCQLL